MSRRSVTLASAAVCLALAACGGSSPGTGGSTEGGPAGSTGTSTAGTATATFPVTVTSCGRTLTFDAPPKRVVVDGEVYALPLFRLGVGDRVTKLANHLSGQIRPNFDVDPQLLATLKGLPALVGPKGGGVSDEALVAEAPDLVIQAYDGADFGAQGGKAAIDRLAGQGLRFFTLAPDCGGDLEESLADITRLGQIFGIPDKAAALLAGTKQRIAAAQAKAKAATNGRVPKVFFLDSIADDGTIYGNTGAFNTELIRTAGGEPVPATGGSDIYTLSKEAVVTARPDIVATYSQDDPPPARLAKLKALQPDAPASKDDRTVVLTYPDGGGTVEYVELLADAIARWGQETT